MDRVQHLLRFLVWEAIHSLVLLLGFGTHSSNTSYHLMERYSGNTDMFAVEHTLTVALADSFMNQAFRLGMRLICQQKKRKNRSAQAVSITPEK